MLPLANGNNNNAARAAARKNAGPAPRASPPPQGGMAHPVQLLLHVHNQARLFHWRTDSYAQHVIAERLYRALGPAIDKFVELLVAAEGAALALPPDIPLALPSLDAAGMTALLRNTLASLSARDTLIAKLCEKHLELASVRDELMEHVGRAVYLFQKGP